MSGGVRARGAAIAALLLLLVPGLARASVLGDGGELVWGYSVYAGAFTEGGGGHFSAHDRDDYDVHPTLSGFRYYERRGLISGMVAGLMVIMGGALEANSKVYLGSSHHGSYRIDYYREHTAAEKSNIMNQANDTAQAAMGSNDQAFELQVFSTSVPGLESDGNGYRLDFWSCFDFGPDIPMSFDLGFGFGEVDALVRTDDTQEYRFDYNYVGVPLRLNYGAPFGLFYLQWDWNWAGHGDERNDVGPGIGGAEDTEGRHAADLRPFALKLGFLTTVMDRVFVEGLVVTPALTSGSFGYRLEAGLRF